MGWGEPHPIVTWGMEDCNEDYNVRGARRG